MYRLWVADRLIRIQSPLPVHDAAHAHFLDLNRTVWHGLPDGERVRDYLGGLPRKGCPRLGGTPSDQCVREWVSCRPLVRPG